MFPLFSSPGMPPPPLLLKEGYCLSAVRRHKIWATGFGLTFWATSFWCVFIGDPYKWAQGGPKIRFSHFISPRKNPSKMGYCLSQETVLLFCSHCADQLYNYWVRLGLRELNARSVTFLLFTKQKYIFNKYNLFIYGLNSNFVINI